MSESDTDVIIDNRDLDTTKISFTGSAEIRPWDLVKNAIENFTEAPHLDYLVDLFKEYVEGIEEEYMADEYKEMKEPDDLLVDFITCLMYQHELRHRGETKIFSLITLPKEPEA